MSIYDVSEYQGDINFSELNADLVIVRVQAGSTHEDTKHKQNEQGLKANHIPFGSYAFGRFVSVSDAIVEANDFYARSDKSSLFYVVDVETVCTRSVQDLVSATQAFIDRLKALSGKKVGLYSGEYFYQSHAFDKIRCDFRWIAKYSSTKPSVPCDLWQFTESTKIPAITANTVDESRLTGTKPLSFFVPETTYTVQSGDTLSGIAAKEHETLQQIEAKNPQIQDPNKIYVGEKINV